MTKKPLIAIIMDEDTSKGGRFYEANKGYFNAGRNIEITPMEGEPTIGKMISADEEKVVLEVLVSAKKKETTQVEIPFNSIKQAVIQISF